MISSQDGTEDRRPRAAFRPWRPVCSEVGSAGATVSPVAAVPVVPAVAADGLAAISAAVLAGGEAVAWFSRAPSTVARDADAGSRDAGRDQELRSAAGGRDSSLLGSPV